MDAVTRSYLVALAALAVLWVVIRARRSRRGGRSRMGFYLLLASVLASAVLFAWARNR